MSADVESGIEATNGADVSGSRTGAEAPTAETCGPRGRRRNLLVLAGCASVALSVGIGYRLADTRGPAAALAYEGTERVQARVSKIARAGADARGGLFAVTPAGRVPLAEGAEITPGVRLATDARTRARVDLDGGGVLVLDRATEIALGHGRELEIVEGALIADLPEGGAEARVKLGAGIVRTRGARLSVTAVPDRANIEVMRGDAEVGSSAGTAQRVLAGQEAVLSARGLDVAPANDLAQRASFGERLVGAHNEDTEAAVSGLGELRARRPGRTDEKDQAVRLTRHSIKVRIAGNVARTEVDEEFTNDTNDELEGIYRFPLPSGAQLERLALEVDGKLVEGEFVDRAKASAIWRGAIHNAAPKAPKPREEIVWVPGPWHDPALLEWTRGGRSELRIFPIPKKGSRRVVIAYTETVAPIAGVRRYVYPLPQGASSRIGVDRFVVDAQITGHDEATAPVRVRGYELQRNEEHGVVHLGAAMTSFTPSGDLTIEYGLDDRKTDVTAWAYVPSAPAAVARDAAEKPTEGRRQADDIVGSDPFVAIALRPKLPRWADTKPRDQVLVVDVGRTMFGERFARARRLLVQLAQEMDRRDRLTVLACDVSCRQMTGGFVAPGSPSAHDVDAFLSGITPDGASDLVGSVRAAARLPDHDVSRDLRIVMVSDGVATAGYRSLSRANAEVHDALGDLPVEVVSVPVGSDADGPMLAELARAGGGVVVPYQPAQRLEATALDVLNATYGTVLRDPEVILPEGLYGAAPAVLPTLRAGSESLVTARMKGDVARGEIVLRGKVGGEAFEAKYPIEVRSSSADGNAFVPRLFASARIADREREPGDAARTELVALSRRFAVPSRFTSLLVLESEAMFQAFGIQRADRGPQWTGEKSADGASSAAPRSPDEEQALASPADVGLLGTADAVGPAKKAAEADAFGGGGLGSLGAGAPAATAAPRPAARAPAGAKDDALGLEAPRTRALAVEPDSSWWERRRGGRFMKKIWVRRATVAPEAGPVVAADKLEAARAAVRAAPDLRSKHKDLVRLLALSGQLDELGAALEAWSARDPLDRDVIVARADLAALRGDRDGAVRILGGALAASALSQDDAFTLSGAVARAYERLNRDEACAFYVSAAELRPQDAATVGRAVACERARGRVQAAERWLAGMKGTAARSAAEAAALKVASSRSESAMGDVVVSASWNGGADLDLAIVDPSGRRAGVVSGIKNVRVEGALSHDHETLALGSNEAGGFGVEVVRTLAASNGSGAEGIPVSGTLTIRAMGETKTVPFTLVGARARLARVDVRWEAQLVPLEDGRPFQGKPVRMGF